MAPFSLLPLLLVPTLVLSLPQSSSLAHDLVEHEKAAVVPASWRRVRAASKTDVLSLRIAIKEHRTVDANDILARSDPRSKLYGEFLDAAELADYLAKASSQESQETSKEEVKRWLAEQGVQVTKESASTFDISLPAPKAESMLGADFSMYTRNSDGSLVARTESYSLPSSLRSHIDYVFPTIHFFDGAPDQADAGLDRRQHNLPTPPFDCSKYWCPINATTQYAIDYIPTEASNSKLAVAGFLEQFPNHQDWTAFVSQFGLSKPENQAPYTVTTVNGGQDPDKIAGTGLEAMLDLEYTSSFTGPLNVTYYSVGGRPPTLEQPGNITLPANQSENEPYLEFLDYLLALDDIPQVVSISYTDDEQTVPYSYATKVCDRFSYLALRGVTVLVASGDAGAQGTRFSNCEGPDGEPIFVPTFPASCPWVTTVGATSAYGGPAGFSSGGFSNYFGRPKWQETAVQSYLPLLDQTYTATPYYSFNTSGRGYPDLTLRGTDYLVISGNYSTSAKGTSASTPVVASMVALLNDLRLKKGLPVLGFLNPIIYAANASAAIDDVTEGNINGCASAQHQQAGYPSAVGWDAASGLGTPNFAKLRQLLA